MVLSGRLYFILHYSYIVVYVLGPVCVPVCGPECGPVLVVVVPVPMFGMVDCSILGVVYCDCSYVFVALPTMFVYNASVAFYLCGGAIRFLDGLQKMCVAYLVVGRSVVVYPTLHLCLDAVSNLRSTGHLCR